MQRSTVTVHHVEDGPPGGPVLVLANSLGTTTAMWDPQVPALAAHHRVVRYDHRGHGGTAVGVDPVDIADLGRDLLALLDRLGVERAHLCGLSIGGMVAMWVAANAPERVDRLALCATSAQLGPPEFWFQRAAAVRAGGTAAIAGAVVDRWFTPHFAADHPDVVAAVRGTSSPPSGAGSKPRRPRATRPAAKPSPAWT
jgi:3-oxoadipate enol-lactonase